MEENKNIPAEGEPVTPEAPAAEPPVADAPAPDLNTGPAAPQEQDGITPGDTLSAYIRSTGSVYTYATAAFGAQWFDGAHVTPGDQWTRISTTLTASATSGTIYFITMGGPGTVWLDCAQLEEGPVANRYNMLINGDFLRNILTYNPYAASPNVGSNMFISSLSL